jgi:hypothetical protein
VRPVTRRSIFTVKGSVVARTDRLELLKRAQDMLWAIAATDVNGVTTHRLILLQNLQEVELKARELGILNLYAAVVETCAICSKY